MGGTTSIFYSGAVEAAAGTIVGNAVSSITSRFEMQERLDATPFKLQQELLKIESAIIEARKRRITNQKLLEWLAQIIDAAHLANYYHRTFKQSNSFPLMGKSICACNLPIAPTYREAKRRRTIKTLLFGDEELKNLHDILEMVKSIDIRTFLDMVYAQPERPMKTYLYMEHNRLLNRDKERQQVMNFLSEPGKAGENNVDILPIVGTKGGGKTSLALHCFYDPKVQNHFPLKIYTCPSIISNDDFDDIMSTIFRDILEKCNSINISSDLNTLKVMLKQKLSSVRFLLMIEHLWVVGSTYMDPMVWKALWDCLRCGKQGSKVILISRMRLPCEIVNPDAAPIILDGFSDDEYTMFFNEHAFGGADPDDYPELAEIGREIAKKMNGSIWGAKILGELLRDNLNAQFWSNFMQNGFMSPLAKSKNIGPVIKTICLLLPKTLQVTGWIWGQRLGEDCPSVEVKTFREIMALGHNHYTPPIEERNKAEVQFLVKVHVFQNRYTVFKVTCKTFEG
ncbi:Disease resistance protein RGA2 [Rhynchospora pubera]|uniref:Disease resistance protein RGA2 n=1 Tax=Rhynchospora pubera TaxID=906938 RepID=A0AAV8FQA3_9POAL|nr:Disease resistance protein RGA2 [Rhynchospora pubera]